MENVIIIAVVVCILAAVIFYLIKAKKRGKHCIGCPHSDTCTKCSCIKKDE